MNHTQSYTINGCIFQEFLLLLGRVVHSNLIRQMEYLKVENEILRAKCPKRITTTPTDKRKLIKYGLACKGRIKGIISIVSYSTFRRWVHPVRNNKVYNGVNGDIGNKYKPSKQNTPRNSTQAIIDLISRLARENCDWGYGRIMDELKKLNIIRLSRNNIKAIMRQNGLDPGLKRTYDSWDAYIKRHFEYLVREYVKYYNSKRPHSGRDNRPLEYNSDKSIGKLSPSTSPGVSAERSRSIKCDSRLG
jgi:putative transposase